MRNGNIQGVRLSGPETAALLSECTIKNNQGCGVQVRPLVLSPPLSPSCLLLPLLLFAAPAAPRSPDPPPLSLQVYHGECTLRGGVVSSNGEHGLLVHGHGGGTSTLRKTNCPCHSCVLCCAIHEAFHLSVLLFILR